MKKIYKEIGWELYIWNLKIKKTDKTDTKETEEDILEKSRRQDW